MSNPQDMPYRAMPIAAELEKDSRPKSLLGAVVLVLLTCVGVVFLPPTLHADETAAKALAAFAAVCFAAVDEKPNIGSIAESFGMKSPFGEASSQFSISMGITKLQVFYSEERKHSIAITERKYTDAREIECLSNAPIRIPSAELEEFARMERLEGDFLKIPGTTRVVEQGKWKRPGNDRAVFVSSVVSSSSTVLNMRRIDLDHQNNAKK